MQMINKILDWFKSLFWKEEMELQHAGKTTFVNDIASGQFNKDMIQTVGSTVRKISNNDDPLVYFDGNNNDTLHTFDEPVVYREGEHENVVCEMSGGTFDSQPYLEVSDEENELSNSRPSFNVAVAVKRSLRAYVQMKPSDIVSKIDPMSCKRKRGDGGYFRNERSSKFQCLDGHYYGKIRVCRIDLERMVVSKLIKPCTVMLERNKCMVRENQRNYQFQHMLGEFKLQVKPKTIRQRMENEQLLRLYHHGHQDDIFESMSPIKKRSLLSDSSVMSDSNQSPSASSNSSIGPFQYWPVLALANSTPKKDDSFSLQVNPVSDSCQYQHCAYIQKKLKERKPRETSKKRLHLLNKRGSFDNLVELVKENENGGVMNEVSQCESYFSFE